MKAFNTITLTQLYNLFDKDAKPKQEFSMLLAGVPGTGKTTWIQKTFWRVHNEAQLLDWGNDAKWSPSELQKRIELEWVYGRGTFVIDDFGTLPNFHNYWGHQVAFQDMIIECVYHIWQGRQKHGDIPNIVITTNLLPNTFKERLGERAWSRLCEMFPVVHLLDEVDFRTQ